MIFNLIFEHTLLGMHFKHPEILWALFLLLIPLIVHLFRLRRFKKEAFTNVRFLKEIDLQTRKSSTLKKWLVLLTRLLGLTMLVIAFAQPYTGDTNAAERNAAYVVYIDNSFSMEMPSQQGSLLETAINRLLDSWPEDISLKILTNNAEYGPGTKSELRDLLLGIEHTTGQLDINEIVLKADAFLPDNGGNNALYIITDLQQDLNRGENIPSTAAEIRVIRLQPNTNANRSIDSLALGDTDPETMSLEIFLSQSGIDEGQNIPVSIFSGNELLARSTAVFEEDNARVMVSLPRVDLENARAEISDAGLKYDNTFFFNLPGNEKINVLHIGNTPTEFLERIYTEDEFNFQSVLPSSIDYNVLTEQNLVILDQIPSLPPALSRSLSELAEQGVSTLQIPALNEDHLSYSELNQRLGLPQREILVDRQAVVTRINYDHPLLKGVFNDRVENFRYPTVRSYFMVSGTVPQVLELSGGLPFLYGRNRHYAFNASISDENSDLKESALIVPVLYNIGLQSLRAPTSYFTLGNNEEADIRISLGNDQIVYLDKGNDPFIPRQQNFGNFVRIFLDEQLSSSGHYSVLKDEEAVSTLSVNYSRAESRLNYLDPEMLENISFYEEIDEGLDAVKSENKVNELWKWFVIFAIAFFLTEMLILKYFK